MKTSTQPKFKLHIAVTLNGIEMFKKLEPSSNIERLWAVIIQIYFDVFIKIKAEQTKQVKSYFLH